MIWSAVRGIGDLDSKLLLHKPLREQGPGSGGREQGNVYGAKASQSAALAEQLGFSFVESVIYKFNTVESMG
jgi:hypothetical protein